MKDPNRLITVTNPGKSGGVKLENQFGEKGNQVFKEPLNKLYYETK